MIETNTIGSLTEIYVGGGKYITESFPTNFHTFHTRKVLLPSDSVDNYKEVTASQKAALEKSDAEWEEPDGLLVKYAEDGTAVYNEATGFFELNGLTDITTRQMRDIVRVSTFDLHKPTQYQNRPELKVRTLSPIVLFNRGGSLSLKSLFTFSSLESVVFTTNPGNVLQPYNAGIGDVTDMFWGSTMLRIAKGIVLSSGTKTSSMFAACYRLEDLELTALNKDLNLDGSPNITLDSLDFIIENRYEQGKWPLSSTAPTEAFSITLHPDAYARLTEELIERAAEKQITFVTT